MEKTDFKIDLAENKLSISAKKSKSETENSESKSDLKVVRKEFSYTEFTRVFTLQKNSNTENITADYTNGILKITIPKKEEQEKKIQAFQ